MPVHRLANCKSSELQAVKAERPRDLLVDRIVQDPRAAQLAPTLLRHPRGEMARPRAAMLDLAVGRNSEPLLGSLVGFHFGHGNTLLAVLCREYPGLNCPKSRMVSVLEIGEKGECEH